MTFSDSDTCNTTSNILAGLSKSLSGNPRVGNDDV